MKNENIVINKAVVIGREYNKEIAEQFYDDCGEFVATLINRNQKEEVFALARLGAMVAKYLGFNDQIMDETSLGILAGHCEKNEDIWLAGLLRQIKKGIEKEKQ